MVSDRLSGTANFSNVPMHRPEKVVNPVTNTSKEIDGKNFQKEIQYSVFKKFNLADLKKLNSQLQSETENIEEYLLTTQPQLNELQSKFIEAEALNSIGISDLKADDIKKKYERISFEFAQKQQRLININEIVPVIEGIIQKKEVSHQADEIATKFINVSKYYDDVRKKFEKTNNTPQKEIINRLFDSLYGTGNLSFRLRNIDDDERPDSYYLIEYLNNVVSKNITIHFDFLGTEKLFDFNDYLNGTFDNAIIESLDNFFQEGFNRLKVGIETNEMNKE